MSFATGMVIGAVMAAAVIAPVALFGRDRALDLLAIQLAAIGAIYAGFALVDARLSIQVEEIAVALAFFAISVVGLWFSPLVLALAYVAHGAWDTAHHLGAVSTAIPRWYPSFCLGYDWLVAVYIWNRFGGSKTNSAQTREDDMTRLYGDEHRALQDEFGTRKLADRVEELVCRTEFDEEARAFIESADMFFLSTVDHKGRPTVSYKGGDAGFVKIVDATTLVFPSYDGNGMFFSMGNIARNAEIGLLFISLERPHRIRVQGRATVSRDDPMMSRYKEADLVVRMKLSELWQNCPRYIHRHQKVAPSRYVPRTACETPVAGWKRIDLMSDALPARDVEKVEAAGTIGIGEWMDKVKSGDPTA